MRSAGFGHRATAALAGVTVAMACVQVATLWSGALGLDLGRAGGLVVLALSLAAGLGMARTFGREAAAGAPEPALPVPRWLTVAAAAAVAWCALVYVRLWALALARPVYDWDGFYYHVPALNGWALEGHVGWITGSADVPFVNYPMAVEAMTFFVHRIAAAAAPVNGVNLWFWPLGFLAMVVLATQLGARGPWRWLAGALVAGVPVIISQSATCYTDPAFGFTVMASLAAMLLFLFDDRASWSRALLLGAALGLMVGAKGGGAPFAVVLVMVSGVASLMVHREHPWVTRVLGGLVVLAVAFAVGGYWYARAFYYTGNPIHPIELKIGAMVLAPGFDHVAFSEANLPEWLASYPAFLRMPVSWLQLDAPIQGYAPVGGLGFLWIALALPASLFLGLFRLRHRDDPAARRFLVLAIAIAMLLAVQTAPWWSRFTIWLHALGIPALVVFLGLLSLQRDRALRVIAIGGVLLSLGVSVWESERTLAIESARGISEEDPDAGYTKAIDAFFPGLSAPEYRGFLDARRIARTRWSRQGTLLGGLLAMPLGQREIRQLDGVPSPQQLDSLRAAGVSWVLWDEVAAGPPASHLYFSALERQRILWDDVAKFSFFRIASDSLQAPK